MGKAARREDPESEQGSLKKAKTALNSNELLWVFLQVLVEDWGPKAYMWTRKLFGATCKACRDRVQEEAIGRRWVDEYCPFKHVLAWCRPSKFTARPRVVPLRCHCGGIISGLLFWQSNCIAHYGCLDKKRAYHRMKPEREESFKNLKWGFLESDDCSEGEEGQLGEE